MSDKRHLPVYGVGPIYGAILILATVIGITVSVAGILDFSKVPFSKIPFIVAGIAVAAFGFWVWYSAAFRIDQYIKGNRLCTDGIYAWVRNPCYSGIMLMCTGAVLMANNFILLILPLFYWIFMTVLMKTTEEKWLNTLYGEAYTEYCRRVNRCIPFPSRKDGSDKQRR